MSSSSKTTRKPRTKKAKVSPLPIIKVKEEMSQKHALGYCQFINFGKKYKGKTLFEVYQSDRPYLLWVKKNVWLNDTTAGILDKLLTRGCIHSVVETPLSPFNTCQSWSCVKCNLELGKIEHGACDFCSKVKPTKQQLDLHDGLCYMCDKELS